MTQVWAVYAIVHYEGSAVVKLFADKAKADELCALLTEYKKLEPPLPQEYEGPEFDAFVVATDHWRELHPAPNHLADEYSVEALELVE